MGNPEAASSAYQQQAQEYELQPPQEYEHTAIHGENTAPTYEPPPPPPPAPGFEQQQQPARFPPPQPNQAYGAQSHGLAIVPDPMQQNNQTYPNGQSAQPMAYPSQGPQQTYPNGESAQPMAYPSQGPQPNPAQPVKFPPPSPQAVPFPPPSQQMRPVYPQTTVQLQTTHMMYPQATTQMPPTVGYQAAAPTMQFQNNGPQAQYGLPVPSPGPKQINSWSSGLLDCMNDPMNAIVTAFFPCLTFGQLAEIVDEGHTTCGTSGMLYGGVGFCIGMPCILSCTYRTKLRNKFSLPEAPAPDWITHFLCEWCALCQEYRELQSRGWDPSIGWQGNLARNQNIHMQQATMMAPMNQRMMG